MRGSFAAVAVLGIMVGVFACTPFSGQSSASGDGDGGSVVAAQDGGADASASVKTDASADASADAGAEAGADAGPAAPIAFVQNVGLAHSDPSTTSLTVTIANAVAAGDLLIARFAANELSATPTTITDTAGDTWHLDAAVSNGTIGTNEVWSTRAAAPLAKNATIVFTFGANAEPYTLVIDEFRGSELASPALAADKTGVTHINGTASDATSDTLSFDVAKRTQVLAIGVVFLQDDSNYSDDPGDAGVPIWQPLTHDSISNITYGTLANCGAYGVVGPKGMVTYAPSLGVMQSSIETIVLY
jgi:hypothetical protein